MCVCVCVCVIYTRVYQNLPTRPVQTLNQSSCQNINVIPLQITFLTRDLSYVLHTGTRFNETLIVPKSAILRILYFTLRFSFRDLGTVTSADLLTGQFFVRHRNV